VFKPTLKQNKKAIIQKRLGDKLKTMVYAPNEDKDNTVINIDTPATLQETFVLTDDEITKLAKWCMLIEEHYGKPMDIEWAKDGITNELFIIQARPETVHSQKNPLVIKEFKLLEKGKLLANGSAIGAKAVSGIARLLNSPKDADKLNKGEIVVTDITSPDWD